MSKYSFLVTSLLLVLLSVVFSSRRAVHASPPAGEEMAQEVEDEVDIEEEAPKPGKFKGYSRHGYRAIQICKAMEVDGRAARFYKFMFPIIHPYEDCVACEQFYRLLGSPCKPKGDPPAKKKPKKTPTPDPEAADTPTPTPTNTPISKQRDPSPEAIERVSFMFNAIASDRFIAKETRIALERLIAIFEADASMTPGERDYFGAIFQAMRDPFNTGPGRPEDTPTPTVGEVNKKLDNLFDR